MNNLNEAIKNIPIPSRMQKLPISEKGFPVPWFVAWPDGKPDFRTVYPERVAQAIVQKRCWICGETLGVHQVFAIGPMCAVSKVTSEPPSHRDCAEYAVKACPFLVNPRARRNEKDLPEGKFAPGGVMIDRNPGVTALWFTKQYRPFYNESEVGKGGILIRVGPAERVDWYCRGRAATRTEVMESVNSGMPELEQVSRAQGREAVAQLNRDFVSFAGCIPK